MREVLISYAQCSSSATCYNMKVSGKTSCQISWQNLSLESGEVSECCSNTEVKTQFIILRYEAKSGPG
jgi:hypothetical protein